MSQIMGHLKQKRGVFAQGVPFFGTPYTFKIKKYHIFEIFVYLPLNNTVKRWQKYSKR